MVLARVAVSVAPDALGVAARLAGRAEIVALVDGVGGGWSASGRWSFVACDPDLAIGGSLPPLEAGGGSDDPLRAVVPRWIGVLPYEAFRADLERASWTGPDLRPRATVAELRWARYPAVIAIDHRAGSVFAVSESERAARALAAAVEAGQDAPGEVSLGVAEEEPPERHVERVRVALEAIRAGEVYQINLARRLLLRAPHELGAEGAIALGRRLLAASPSPFGAVMATPAVTFVSTSPELLLDARIGPDGGFAALRTDPIKGTRPRRVGAARELDADPKERAELAMIVDVERNDLGRVAAVGSVEVVAPHVVRAGRVLHRIASVRALARAGVPRAEVLLSVVPSGSVTGAPKIRAMELIAGLEPMRRGLYTGGFGLQAQDGSLRLAMAIRTAVFPAGGGGEGEWLVGGGIVEASDPDRELEETRWKSQQLASVVARGPGTWR